MHGIVDFSDLGFTAKSFVFHTVDARDDDIRNLQN